MRVDYYNDNDPFVVRWLRNLVDAGLIPKGEVDGKDIREIEADDLTGYRRVHLFSGIAGWPYALQLAGWPEDREVWTGSCPCQPLSCAGKREGEKDERHLWPEFYRLISERMPDTIFGEQVGSGDGREWLDGVSYDLEELGYAVGSICLPACSVGAPHIRQRLWWVADANFSRKGDKGIQRSGAECVGRASKEVISGLADSSGKGLEGWAKQSTREERKAIERGCNNSGMGDNNGSGSQTRLLRQEGFVGSRTSKASGVGDSGCERQHGKQILLQPRRSQQTNFEVTGSSFWGDYSTVQCGDGKSRRVESGTFPLAHGVPGRVGKLRAYGNAIVPQVAAEFVRAYMDVKL